MERKLPRKAKSYSPNRGKSIYDKAGKKKTKKEDSEYCPAPPNSDASNYSNALLPETPSKMLTVTNKSANKSLPPKQKMAPIVEFAKKSKSQIKKISTDRKRKPQNFSAPVRRSLGEKSGSSSKSSSNSSLTSKNTPTKQSLIKKNRDKAKRENQKSSCADTDREKEQSSRRSLVEALPPVEVPMRTAEDNSYVRAPPSLRLSGHQAIIASRMQQFAWECEQTSLEIFKAQFESLPKPDPKECRIGSEPRNTSKNRYTNIPCLDVTRVTLTFPEYDKDSNYIHANRVEYKTLHNPFIITQGPLTRTAIDFWRMIWQENVESILMLCRTVENNKKKSAEYFHSSLNVSIELGLLKVTLKEKKKDEELITSVLHVEYNDETRIVYHYQWTEWPDCRVPTASVRPMFTMLRKVRGSRHPVVVHCSAGIGRSGTLVALEMCLMEVANGESLDVHKIVTSLRKCRAHAVQTLDQYLAISKAVLEFAEQNGCIKKIDVEHFFRMYFAYVLDT